MRIDPALGNVAWSSPDRMAVALLEEDGYWLPGTRTGPEGARLKGYTSLTLVYEHERRIHADGDVLSLPGATDAVAPATRERGTPRSCGCRTAA